MLITTHTQTHKEEQTATYKNKQLQNRIKLQTTIKHNTTGNNNKW